MRSWRIRVERQAEMSLPHYAKATPFRVGLAVGILLFLAANVHSYWVNPCFYEHGWCGFGFPFECGYGFPFGPTAKLLPFQSRIIWGGLVANSFIAVTASILLGRLCNKLFKAAPVLK